MAEQEPMVTTIIPTFGRAGRLARAVESALSQVYPATRHEVIVVDDGSPDQGANEAALAPYRSRTRYLQKDNGGVSSARNLGIARASGTLIAFLDDDDTWVPDKLRKQVDFIVARPHCGLVGSEFVRLDATGREVGRSQLREVLSDEQPNIAQALRYAAIPPSAMLVRKEVVEEIGGFDTGLMTAEDIDFQLRIARRWGIGVVPEPLIRYRMGQQDGLSYGKRTYWDHLGVVRKHLSRNAEKLGPEQYRGILFRHLVRNGRGLISGGWCLDGMRLVAAGAVHARTRVDALALTSLGAVLARWGAVTLAHVATGRRSRR